MSLRPLGPEPSASANSATSATIKILEVDGINCQRNFWSACGSFKGGFNAMIGKGIIFITFLLFLLSGEEIRAYEPQANSLEQRIDKGREFSKQGRYEEALKAFEEAINLKPQSFEAWMGKGSTLMHMARFKEAGS